MTGFSFGTRTSSIATIPTALAEHIYEMYVHRLPPDATDGGPLAFERQLALGIYMARELQMPRRPVAPRARLR